MKKALLAAGALGAVLALLLTSGAMGFESEDRMENGTGTGIELENEPIQSGEQTVDIDQESDEVGDPFQECMDGFDIGTGQADSTGNVGAVSNASVPVFAPLVKRSYDYLSHGFVKMNSRWGPLPPVKAIYTANSSGEWMHDALPRINSTGEALIIDRDMDGYPELVVWRHHGNVTRTPGPELNRSISVVRERLNNTDMPVNITCHAGFILYYLDRDGDANPEIIGLNVFRSCKVDINNDGRPEMAHMFRWKGITVDRNDDGNQDHQMFKTYSRTVVDRNRDGNPEMLRTHSARYSRFDTSGRSMWDGINAKARSKMYVDRNSDGNPERRNVTAVKGLWKDRNGNGWPEIIRIGGRRMGLVDSNSDGNPEIRRAAGIRMLFMDRNDDRYPEIVSIVYRSVSVYDRDSNGSVDLIVMHTKIFKWIDRDSDGIPERVIRRDDTVIRHPGNDTRNTDGKRMRMHGRNTGSRDRKRNGSDDREQNGQKAPRADRDRQNSGERNAMKEQRGDHRQPTSRA